MQSKPNPPNGIGKGLLIGVLVLCAGPFLGSVASMLVAPLLLMIPAAPKERAGAITPGVMAACLIVSGAVGVVFFGHVMRQLVRAIRGLETAHLAPRWVLVPAAFVIGAIGVGMVVAGLFGAGGGMPFGGAGACVVMLAYAFRELRKGARTHPAVATDPQGIGLQGDSDRNQGEGANAAGAILTTPGPQTTKRKPMVWVAPLVVLAILPFGYGWVARGEPTSLTCDRAKDRCEVVHGWVIHRREELRVQDLISAEVKWDWDSSRSGSRSKVYWVKLITGDAPRPLGAATPDQDEKLDIASKIKAFANDPSAPSLQVRQHAWMSRYIVAGLVVGIYGLVGLAFLIGWLRKPQRA